jgi:hypothetical protein
MDVYERAAEIWNEGIVEPAFLAELDQEAMEFRADCARTHSRSPRRRSSRPRTKTPIVGPTPRPSRRGRSRNRHRSTDVVQAQVPLPVACAVAARYLCHLSWGLQPCWAMKHAAASPARATGRHRPAGHPGARGTSPGCSCIPTQEWYGLALPVVGAPPGGVSPAGQGE